MVVWWSIRTIASLEKWSGTINLLISDLVPTVYWLKYFIIQLPLVSTLQGSIAGITGIRYSLAAMSIERLIATIAYQRYESYNNFLLTAILAVTPVSKHDNRNWSIQTEHLCIFCISKLMHFQWVIVICSVAVRISSIAWSNPYWMDYCLASALGKSVNWQLILSISVMIVSVSAIVFITLINKSMEVI